MIKLTQIFLEDEPWHSCYVKTCRETFSKFDDLRAHVDQSHSSFKPSNYPCAQKSCKGAFTTPKEWIQHLADKHGNFVVEKEIEFFDRYFLKS
ncbi:hypothetical protein HOLleu_29009 [Holothuria leucospilota]|uniref:C2H2-type domain-containing protein n=1 Tax=Holothuria leucospilota TaxID=206669 RepID=A0A9Q1H1D1_HOLLE|nr:hypothetical protein HOLleu_29009 [Holothuria leucospilota]